MIGKTLILVSAIFALAAGSCYEIQMPQRCSSPVVSIPVAAESSSCQSAPVVPENILSSGSFFSAPATPNFFVQSCSSPVSTPVVSSAPVISAPVVSFSDNSFSNEYFSQSSNGPETTTLPVIQASPATLPAVEGPLVTISTQQIPAPRVLSTRCFCTKTILKPQLIQRTITVPKIQRYLKRTVTPVIENITYKTTPVSQNIQKSYFSAGSGSPVYQSGCGSSPIVISSGSSSSSCPRFC